MDSELTNSTAVQVANNAHFIYHRADFERWQNKDGNKDQARRDAERMAAYYKWLNELRNSEEKVKATYTDSVQTYLADHYDAQIAELGQKLAQVSDACEAHIRIATQVDQLLLSAGNEIAELALAL